MNILHGFGKNQKFLRKSYEADRNRALKDRTKFEHDELVDLEVTASGDGIGKIKREAEIHAQNVLSVS